ncbi:MAG: DUF928 domain-containing protein, partial [Coleofasciculus sp. S288]|nr:DUF928 domain-containing protein [Coleofasciculus sp. S288]
MTGTKLPLHQIKHAFATTSALVSLVSYPASVLAQPVASTSNSSDKIPISFNQQAEDGSSRGRPSRREGTGSRGDCPPVEIPLTALVPAGNVGLTLEKHPTFWFYVPYSPGDTASGEFVLQDEANNDVYRTSLTLPREPGVVSFSLPSATPLEM